MPLLAKDGAKKEQLINRTVWETGSLFDFPTNDTRRKFSRRLAEDCSLMFHWNWRNLNSASSFLTQLFTLLKGVLCHEQLLIEPAPSCAVRSRQRKQRAEEQCYQTRASAERRIVKQHPDSASLRRAPLCRSRSLASKATGCWEVKTCLCFMVHLSDLQNVRLD